MILEGLTKLRQLANHPKMVDANYAGDSGKFEDITHMLASALAEDHKVLVFSQYVKHLELVRQYLKTHKIDKVVHGAIASVVTYGALLGATAE